MTAGGFIDMLELEAVLALFGGTTWPECNNSSLMSICSG